MSHPTPSFPLRRTVSAVSVAVGMLLGTGVAVLPSTALAVVDPSGQRCFTVTGEPGDAAIVNLTPVRASAGGFGLLISSDIKANPPTASNANYQPGSVDPNVAVGPIGRDGRVCFQNSDDSSVDLVADHLGTVAASAYSPATSTGAPDRRVDTRTDPGANPVAPSGQLCFSVTGNPGDGAIVNLTPVRASARGFGQLISSDIKTNPSNASNTNFVPGSVDPNVAITPIGADGEVCFQNSDDASVDLIADHLGTIAASAYTPATPTGAPDRRVDTRTDPGARPVGPSGQLCFSVTGAPGDAAIVNLTPVRASAGGFGQLISSDIKATPPNASNANYQPGSVDPNVAITPIGADGEVCFQNSDDASVDLIADHLGTIAASAYNPATPTGAPDRRVDTRTDVENARQECFAPTSDSYSTEIARTMFGLASQAYEIDPGEGTGQRLDLIGDDVRFADQMSCWKLVTAIRGDLTGLGQFTDTELIVARNTETRDLAVAFRGTEGNVFDILNDLDARRLPWTLPNGTAVEDAVHRGFASAYESVQSQLLQILTAVQRADAPDARVFFTGHSLGGALASLAAIDLVDDLQQFGYSNTEVVTYTFGAPRAMSREMAGHHANLVPSSFAVANPQDPIPQLPTAIGSNHYSHLKNMTVLHSFLLDSRVRVDRGDGRNHRGCVATAPTTTRFALYHPRGEYNRRLASTDFVGRPSVSITVAQRGSATAGRLQLRWDTPLEGPCDEAALYRTSGTPTNNSTAIRDRDVVFDTNNVHSTTVIKGDNYWIGYVNMFGEIVSKREYVPTTPSVSLRRRNIPGPDTIDLRWSVSDPGSKDLVVLFDRDPRIAGPEGYYRSLVGRVESDPLVTNSPGPKAVFVTSNPNKWWVAYIMEDGDGNKRILSVSRGVSG